MPTEEARRERIESLSRSVHLMFVAVVAVGVAAVVALFAQSYGGRVEIVNSQRWACEHVAKPRDRLNASGWRTAQARANSQGQPRFAARYGRIARFLEGPKGARADCDARYPSPSPWPWAQ